MPEMREASPGHLDPAQAAELSLLVDLEAHWDNLRKSPSQVTGGATARGSCRPGRGPTRTSADRVGVRMDKGRVRRSAPPGTFRAAIGELEALTRWCDDLAGGAGQPATAEVPTAPSEVRNPHAYSG